MLSIYRHYAGAGFHLGKQPAMEKCGNGHKPGDWAFYGADARQAVDWITQMGGNVSVAPVDPFVFLDYDGVNRALVARARMALGGNLWEHSTPSGGSHMLVAVMTSRLPHRNGAIEFEGGKVDVKGSGRSYVIGPGSRTPDGLYHGIVGTRVPRLDDAALDRLLRVLGGELANGACGDTPPVVVRGDLQPRIEAALIAIREGLVGGPYKRNGSLTYGQAAALTVSLGLLVDHDPGVRAAWFAKLEADGRWPRGARHRDWDAKWEHGNGMETDARKFAYLVADEAASRGVANPFAGLDVFERAVVPMPVGDWTGGEWLQEELANER